jgi:dCMP deaminase
MKHDFFIKTALLLSQESKCVSRKVGTVLVHDNRIISIGYNGTLPGFKNCNEVFDENNYSREDHHKFSEQLENHGELNNLLFAAKHGISTQNTEIYTTLFPCDNCLKNLCQSGVNKVYYLFEYDKSDPTNPYRSRIELINLYTPEIKKFIEINELKKLY